MEKLEKKHSLTSSSENDDASLRKNQRKQPKLKHIKPSIEKGKIESNNSKKVDISIDCEQYIAEGIVKDLENTMVNAKSKSKREARDVPKDLPKITEVNQVTNFVSEGLIEQGKLTEIVLSENEHLVIPDQLCDSDDTDTTRSDLDKQFRSTNDQEVHSVVHTGDKLFVCGLCGKKFARKCALRNHERTHTGERPYQCGFCGATFGQKSNLLSHKRATHYDDKKYRCEDCGKGFKRRRLLDYHIKAAHTGERPFKCEICEATFIYPEHFKKHRRIHTGEKPFVCEVCGKAFTSRDNRNAHRFVHSDKKPYECLVCGAGFMRKPLLYQHMQSEGHLNDTIVVNQPRLTLDDKLTIGADSHLVRTQDEAEGNESKLFIAGEDETEHIIIDGCPVMLANSDNDEEAAIDGIEQLVSTDVVDYDEILTTKAISSSEKQIIQTPNDPIQLVKVPPDSRELDEVGIKITPE